MNVLQCWSGGKDSTLSAYLHLERGDNVTLVCCLPYFDDEIPLISKSQIQFIFDKANFFRALGANVIILRGMTYYDYCTHNLMRGKFKSYMRGYPVPLTGKCGFMRESKQNPIRNYVKNNISKFDYMDISYTIDEERGSLNSNQISLLRQLNLTQNDVFLKCRELNLLSPVYSENKKRDGCLLCYNGNSSERRRWFDDYAEFNAFARLYNLQLIVKENAGREIYPLRLRRFFIEDNNFISYYGTQISFLGPTIN